jgi:hypothetical protein
VPENRMKRIFGTKKNRQQPEEQEQIYLTNKNELP